MQNVHIANPQDDYSEPRSEASNELRNTSLSEENKNLKEILWVLQAEKPNEDFPGGQVVNNLPCNAGEADSIPREGIKIPSAVGQLSLHATTREPMRPDTAK